MYSHLLTVYSSHICSARTREDSCTEKLYYNIRNIRWQCACSEECRAKLKVRTLHAFKAAPSSSLVVARRRVNAYICSCARNHKKRVNELFGPFAPHHITLVRSARKADDKLKKFGALRVVVVHGD